MIELVIFFFGLEMGWLGCYLWAERQKHTHLLRLHDQLVSINKEVRSE